MIRHGYDHESRHRKLHPKHIYNAKYMYIKVTLDQMRWVSQVTHQQQQWQSVSVLVLPLRRGPLLISEIFDMPQKAKLVRLIVTGRGKWRDGRLMRHINCRQMMMVQRMMRSMRVKNIVRMGNLKVPWWRGSGQERTRVSTRKNRRRWYSCRLHTWNITLLLILLCTWNTENIWNVREEYDYVTAPIIYPFSFGNKVVRSEAISQR